MYSIPIYIVISYLVDQLCGRFAVVKEIYYCKATPKCFVFHITGIMWLVSLKLFSHFTFFQMQHMYMVYGSPLNVHIAMCYIHHFECV